MWDSVHVPRASLLEIWMALSTRWLAVSPNSKVHRNVKFTTLKIKVHWVQRLLHHLRIGGEFSDKRFSLNTSNSLKPNPFAGKRSIKVHFGKPWKYSIFTLARGKKKSIWSYFFSPQSFSQLQDEDQHGKDIFKKHVEKICFHSAKLSSFQMVCLQKRPRFCHFPLICDGINIKKYWVLKILRLRIAKKPQKTPL